MSRTALTDPEIAEIITLRQQGMMIPDVVIAMQHFRGVHVSYGQVRRVSARAGAKRGPRPIHARCRTTNIGAQA